MIIVPTGPTKIRITIKIDDKGNSNIDAVDMQNVLRLPGQTERPLPLTALETLYWLSKCQTDALAATVKQVAAAREAAAGRGGNEEKPKAD